MNLIVEYEGGYLNGKSEIESVIRKLGDDKVEIEILVPGVLGIKTELTARRVTEELRELMMGESGFKFIKKAIPIDEWVAVEEVPKLVEEDFKSVIADALYRVDVVVRKGDVDANALVEKVKKVVNGRYEENRPQKIIRVEVFDKQAGVSLIKELDVFSC